MNLNQYKHKLLRFVVLNRFRMLTLQLLIIILFILYSNSKKSKLKTTGEQTKNLNRIRNNQNWRQSNVIMVPTKPMAVEKFLECLRLGRFDVRDMRAVLRVGVIKDILKISRDEKVTKATKNRRNNELSFMIPFCSNHHAYNIYISNAIFLFQK